MREVIPRHAPRPRHARWRRRGRWYHGGRRSGRHGDDDATAVETRGPVTTGCGGSRVVQAGAIATATHTTTNRFRTRAHITEPDARIPHGPLPLVATLAHESYIRPLGERGERDALAS